MNSKQLMIGDYVLQDDNLQQNRICQITGLFDHCVVEVTGEKVPLHESHIKPIDLTPEILEKIGFERYVSGPLIMMWTGYGKDNEDDIEVDFDIRNNYINIKIDVVGHYYRGEMKYLHELQHLFTQFNINIKIDL
jgi:hypothetical protein